MYSVHVHWAYDIWLSDIDQLLSMSKMVPLAAKCFNHVKVHCMCNTVEGKIFDIVQLPKCSVKIS